ncbi:MAG: D-alanyl-D-alanine carboxypeptidase [Clostridia bacterium]|nr:D-alanyl-D-alanine carboxypeptidase [Clostridia bacterium]
MNFIRRLSLALALILIIGCIVPLTAVAEGEEPAAPFSLKNGNAAIAYCIDTDQFLYSDLADKETEPSVAAKLVACMVAYDILKERNLNINDTMVEISESAIAYINGFYNDDVTDRIFVDFRMPTMGLDSGSSYTARDMLSAILVAGANDATAALASYFGKTYLGGDLNTFVSKMNEKAESLGLTKTYFRNPMGLTQEGQTSTPKEVALIAAAFYKNYNELVTLSDVEFFSFNKKTTVRNKNFLKNNYFISGYKSSKAIGLTAGQPNADGNYCLITATQQTEGLTYILVVMCANGIRVENTEEGAKYSLYDKHAYGDMIDLLSWVRESFVYYTVADSSLPIDELRVKYGSPSDHLMVYPKANINHLIPKNESVNIAHDPIEYYDFVYSEEFNGAECPTANAPIKAETVVGTVKYYYTDAQGNRVDFKPIEVMVKETAEENTGLKVLDDAGNILTNVFMRTVLIILGVVIGLYILVSITMAIIRGVKKNQTGKSGKKKSPDKKSKKPAKPAPKSGAKTKPQDNNKDNTATRQFD